MNTTQFCVAGIVVVVAMGVVADIKARFKKKPEPQPKPRMSDDEVRQVVKTRIREAYPEDMHGIFDILDDVCHNKATGR